MITAKHSMPTYRVALLLALVLALLAGLLAGCGPVPPPASPTARQIDVKQPQEQPFRFFAPDQVVLAGPRSVVDDAFEKTQLGLERRTRLALEPDRGLAAACPRLADDVAHVAACLKLHEEPWVIDLYQGNVQVPDLVRAFAEYDCVFPTPNYLTGDPWTGAGSPWTGAGSPWTGAGSPWLGPSGTGATLDEYHKQWALEQIGVMRDGIRAIDALGGDVTAGVFDTSPFAAPDDSGKPLDIRDPFHLTVWYPPVSGPWAATRDPSSLGVASHGLYVAGLLHEVSPDSDVHLYRVLDDNAQGDLFTLDGALLAFITRVQATPGGKGVINLSLGIHRPDDWKEQGFPPEVTALELLLAYARCQGMVVVAAAGNERQAGRGAPDPQMPASYPFVVGVAGNNVRRAPACFSNRGRLAAPAGDGLTGCTPCAVGCSKPRLLGPILKPCARDCQKYSLIGPVLKPGRPAGILYAYWVGTSFAAPLASGQAALLLGAGRSGPEAESAMTGTAADLDDPTGVVDTGEINVPASLLP